MVISILSSECLLNTISARPCIGTVRLGAAGDMCPGGGGDSAGYRADIRVVANLKSRLLLQCNEFCESGAPRQNVDSGCH